MTVVLNELALDDLLLSPTSPVSRHIERYASTDILALAKDTISRAFPGGRGPFPPPGPPYRRAPGGKDKASPDLHDSLTVVAHPTSAGMEYDIVPTAVKRGYNYGDILKGRGYRFLPDSYYL
jgi:hypothetical protein